MGDRRLLPVYRGPEKVKRVFEKLGRSVDRILEEAGMAEEELAQLFDLCRSVTGWSSRQTRDQVARRLLGRGLEPEGLYVLDALVIDRHFDRFRRGKRRLSDLARYYGVELADAHNAAADAEAAARVVLAMADIYPELAWASLGDLTASQVLWHWEWAEDFSGYLERNSKAPLAPSEYLWPVSTMAEEPQALAAQGEVRFDHACHIAAGDASSSEIARQTGTSGFDDDPFAWPEEPLEEVDCEAIARLETARSHGQQIAQALQRRVSGLCPSLIPLVGVVLEVEVSADHDFIEVLFGLYDGDALLLSIPASPWEAVDLYRMACEKKGKNLVALIKDHRGRKGARHDGVLVALCSGAFGDADYLIEAVMHGRGIGVPDGLWPERVWVVKAA